MDDLIIIRGNNVLQIRKFYDEEISPEALGEKSWLRIAINYKDEKLAKKIISDKKFTWRYYEDPYYAAQNGWEYIVKEMFKDRNLVDYYKKSLDKAIRSEDSEAANLLIECYDECGQDHKINNEILISLLRDFNINFRPFISDLVLKLIKLKNIDLNFADQDGNTALLYACQYNRSDIIKELLNCNLDHRNKKGVNIFDVLINNGSDILMDLIKNKKYNSESVDSDGDNILLLACRQKRTDIAFELIKNGDCSYDMVDVFGKNVMNYAKENKMTDVIEMLEQIKNSLLEQNSENDKQIMSFELEEELVEIDEGIKNEVMINKNNLIERLKRILK